ncbi:MAG: type II toxin-antitoxin system RelE/ParE family toxin [Lachnospiraceae bacterium]|jgi:plasmid stabilization system protein ParE|nr:type II toxin-antitoxin system RelE/ParE family toxin [Lachnospiraceae bacterium]
MDKNKKYKVHISKDALFDIKLIKRYLLTTAHYHEYAEHFSRSIKKAIRQLELFPLGNEKTEYNIQGFTIYYRSFNTYLIFFVIIDQKITVIRVLSERMHWQSIIRKIHSLSSEIEY